MTSPTEAAPRVAVLDYDAGNVRSAQRGLLAAGAAAFITGDADEAAAADGGAGSTREASSYEAMIQSSTRLESLITKNEQEETKERNIAYLKPAFQSSTADGRAAAVVAVTGALPLS